MSEKAFVYRYLLLILLAVVLTRLAGISFMLFTDVLAPAEVIAIFTAPLMVLFNVFSILIAWGYFYLYASPVRAWLRSPSTELANPAMKRVRYFPHHFWALFLLTLLVAPTLVMWVAEHQAGVIFDFERWARIRVIALTISVLVGVPIFFLLLDLFGSALPGLIRGKPVLTLRSKVLLIACLMPFLVTVMVMQYFWARTGHLTMESLWVAAALLVLVAAGAWLVTRSFRQSLAPLQSLLAQKVELDKLDLSTLASRSHDELGILANEYRRLLERHRHAESALARETQRALVTLQSIGDGVITIDTNGIIEYLNPVAEQLLDRRSPETVGCHYTDVLKMRHDGDEQTLHHLVEMILHHEGTMVHVDDGIVRHTDGSEFNINVSVASMRGPDGGLVGVVLVLHDITEVMEMARQLGHQAAHDMLTGLYNRREFERRLEAAIREAHSDHAHHVLFYMDLDQFKVVNDTYGHRAGDALLRQLAQCIDTVIRDHDVLARLGGDEFGILLHNCPLEKAREIAEQIRRLVQEFRFRWNDRLFEIGMSIGVVPIHTGSGGMADVMSCADAACYVAKEAGRNRVHVYTRDDKAVARHSREMEWIHRIHDAFEDDRFILYHQPIVPTRDIPGHPCYGEVLVRMLDERGELIPPTDFIPAAERYNLMPVIDRWVVRAVIERLCQASGSMASPPLHCAINLSGQSLNDEGFLDYVLNILRTSGIPCDSLCFEITETAAITNLSAACRFIERLKQSGCCFALDDFGSGLSSFTYLKALEVDYLKIDGAFIRDILDSPLDRTMVAAINQIGHAMGLKTIAEFVENEAIMAAVRDLGIDYAQGYGIARPGPLDDAISRLITVPMET